MFSPQEFEQSRESLSNFPQNATEFFDISLQANIMMPASAEVSWNTGSGECDDICPVNHNVFHIHDLPLMSF
jgi:hypothetical protein